MTGERGSSTPWSPPLVSRRCSGRVSSTCGPIDTGASFERSRETLDSTMEGATRQRRFVAPAGHLSSRHQRQDGAVRWGPAYRRVSGVTASRSSSLAAVGQSHHRVGAKWWPAQTPFRSGLGRVRTTCTVSVTPWAGFAQVRRPRHGLLELPVLARVGRSRSEPPRSVVETLSQLGPDGSTRPPLAMSPSWPRGSCGREGGTSVVTALRTFRGLLPCGRPQLR